MDIKQTATATHEETTNMTTTDISSTPVAITVDGHKLYAGDEWECPYCGRSIPAELYDAEPKGNPDDWKAAIEAHGPDCDWIIEGINGAN